MTTTDTASAGAALAADLVAGQYTAARERYPDPECWIAWLHDPALDEHLAAAVDAGLILRLSPSTYIPASKAPERDTALADREAVVAAAAARAETSQARARAWGDTGDHDPVGGMVEVPVWILAALLDTAGAD